MKNLLFILLGSFLMIACQNDPKEMVQHLEGYWEISEVKLNSGETREYKINETIDYFNIDDTLSGYRKKVRPNFEGTFETSNIKENINLRIENDSLHIYYTTPYANWKETILKADTSELKIVTAKKDIYIYKRYIPLNLN